MIDKENKASLDWVLYMLQIYPLPKKNKNGDNNLFNSFSTSIYFIRADNPRTYAFKNRVIKKYSMSMKIITRDATCMRDHNTSSTFTKIKETILF